MASNLKINMATEDVLYYLANLNVHLEKVGNSDADELKDLLASFDICLHASGCNTHCRWLA